MLYLEGDPSTGVTVLHSLVWLQNLKDLSGHLARWSVRLKQYDFKIIDRAGTEFVLSHILSRHISAENDTVAELELVHDR